MGNYFQAQGIKIIRGRDFTPADREGAPLVVIYLPMQNLLNCNKPL